MNNKSSLLKYPVLLVHGMGFRDYKHLCYWGRIPRILEEMGCRVFFGGQDSNAGIETNARHLEKRLEEILNETGAQKVNIIAHSTGGLESRYLISVLGKGSKVASLTTISTPHHGSKTVDKLLKAPDCLVKFGCFLSICGSVCSEIKCRIHTRLSTRSLPHRHPSSTKKLLILKEFIIKAMPLL